MASSKPAKEEEYVRFIGTYNYREITDYEFARAGVLDHPTVRWDMGNGFVVPRSDLKLSDDDFQRIIEADPYFRVVTGDQANVAKGVHRWPPAM